MPLERVGETRPTLYVNIYLWWSTTARHGTAWWTLCSHFCRLQLDLEGSRTGWMVWFDCMGRYMISSHESVGGCWRHNVVHLIEAEAHTTRWLLCYWVIFDTGCSFFFLRFKAVELRISLPDHALRIFNRFKSLYTSNLYKSTLPTYVRSSVFL